MHVFLEVACRPPQNIRKGMVDIRNNMTSSNRSVIMPRKIKKREYTRFDKE